MDSSSITRISGLASGMDTDSIVKKLMTAESASMNKMKQSQQKYEWQSDGYRQWNSDLFSFYTNTLFSMKLSGQYGTYNLSSSDSSSVTGTATASAIPGTYSLEVDHLAQSATMVTNVSLDTTNTFSDQNLGDSGSFTITTTDQTGKTVTSTISVDATKDKIGDVVSRINSAKDSTGNSLNVQAIYDSTLHQFILKTKDTGAKTNITISAVDTDTDKGLSFLKNTIKFSPASTANGINSTTNIDGSMVFSTLTADSTNNKDLYFNNRYASADASINFNGSSITSSSNSLSILGVNYNILNAAKDVNGNYPNSTITISRDLDTEVKNIKDFISKYNDMLDKLNKAIDEPVYSDYQPLTDDQRTAMTDNQIEQWETKAKSGLFHSDSILSGLVNNMRNHITSTVDNGSKYNSLSSIGIESSSYQDKGKLYVDENKLRAALQDDPDAVKNLFTQDSTGAKDGQRGIIQRVYDDVTNSVKLLTDKAGKTGAAQNDQSYVGKLLSKLNTQIDDEQQRLTNKENQYYKQFTAMETAMSKYNSQSSWLSQQLSTNG
jgi:flagellar hook-associated protein 2